MIETTPKRFTLPNGLTVVAVCNRPQPVAAFQIWVKVGSADETPSEVGLAHLHEHMLFKGTARRGPGEIARSVEAHGGEINAWTSYDQTAYHVVMAGRFAREGLDVLADAVRSSAFDPGELSREIEVVCEEIKRSADQPSRRASKQLFAEAYRAHPYGRPVIGFEENVRAHTRDGVLGFYKKHYTPKNCVLAAVGNFDEATLRVWAEDLLGGEWGGTYEKPAPRTVEPENTSLRAALSKDPVKEAWLHAAFALPELNHPDTPALDVLAMVMGQSDASRLSLEVKRRRALAQTVSAWAYTPKDPGLFGVSLTATEANALAALEATVQVVRAFQLHEVSDGELATVKALIESEATWAKETAQGLSRRLGYFEAVAGGVEREAEYFAAVRAVTPKRLVEVANRWLEFDRAVVTGLLPQDSALDEAAVLGAFARGAKEPRWPETKPVAAPAVQPHASRRAAHEHDIGLKNGARLIIREDHSHESFAMRATFPGGVRFETEKDNGLSALLSRTLTRGTAQRTSEEVTRACEALQGGVSTVAGRSSFSVRADFLSRNPNAALELFAEVMLEPSFTAAEVEREKQRLLQDISTREDRPSSLAFELFGKTLWQVHPYRLSTQGEAESVKALDAAALKARWEQLRDPARMTLAVVGDVDTDAVVAWAERRLGGLSTGSRLAEVPQEPAWTGPREAHRELKKAQTHLVLGFPGAKVTEAWRRPLEVLSTVLSGQSGRLFMTLRDQQSLAYSVSSMTLEGVDPGYFALYVGTSPEKVEQALSGMKQQLVRLRDEKISPEELLRAQTYLVGTHEIALQRPGSRAGHLALDACYGLPVDTQLRYPEQILSVSADDVLQVARRVIDFEKSALAMVGPRG